MPYLDDSTTLRIERGAQHVYNQGARSFAEFLSELGQRHDIFPEISDLLDGYSRCSPELVRQVGGDRFPPHPLRLVPRSPR